MVVMLSIGSIHFGLEVTDEDSGGGGGMDAGERRENDAGH
jgi:hypothetical protein